MTSFLSDITYYPLETWLLPKSDMLCMIRCQEDPPGDVHENGQVTKSMDEENQRKESRTPPRPRTSGPWSILLSSLPAAQHLQAPGIRPEPRNSARSPDIRRHASEPTEVASTSPDIRPPCLRTVKGRGPCTPSPPRLYILL